MLLLYTDQRGLNSFSTEDGSTETIMPGKNCFGFDVVSNRVYMFRMARRLNPDDIRLSGQVISFDLANPQEIKTCASGLDNFTHLVKKGGEHLLIVQETGFQRFALVSLLDGSVTRACDDNKLLPAALHPRHAGTAETAGEYVHMNAFDVSADGLMVMCSHVKTKTDVTAKVIRAQCLGALDEWDTGELRTHDLVHVPQFGTHAYAFVAEDCSVCIKTFPTGGGTAQSIAKIMLSAMGRDTRTITARGLAITGHQCFVATGPIETRFLPENASSRQERVISYVHQLDLVLGLEVATWQVPHQVYYMKTHHDRSNV